PADGEHFAQPGALAHQVHLAYAPDLKATLKPRRWQMKTAQCRKRRREELCQDDGRRSHEGARCAPGAGEGREARRRAGPRRRLQGQSRAALKSGGRRLRPRVHETMVEDHQHAVKAFEKHATSATDPELRKLLTDTLPRVREHLKHAQEISGSLK